MDPQYVKNVFMLISEDADHLGEKEKEFVNIYFKKTYINKFNIHDWNYYKIYDHHTNNAGDSFHHVLNSKFNKKPTFWKQLTVLKNEENLLYIEIYNL